jgi:putative DNA primase/helicase
MGHYNSMADDIVAAGFNPPDHIAPGKFYRYAGLDKKPSNRAGYCRLFDDCKAGVFGDFSTGFQQMWFDGNSRDLTLKERMKLRDEIRIAQGHRDADFALIQGDVAKDARIDWASVSREITSPYPIRKNFTPYGARQNSDALLVPMFFNGKLVNLQRIFSDGGKYPLKGGRVKGCYFPIGKIIDHVLICEGFATGCSLRQHTGSPVIVAFNAGGLKPVALSVRKKYPRIRITIACDNDWGTEEKTGINPGMEKGRAAAAVVGGDIIYPDFSDEDFSGTDYNDYLTHGGEL